MLSSVHNVVKHFLHFMLSNPSDETSETVLGVKMGIFAVNDEMNLAKKLNYPKVVNYCHEKFNVQKVNFKLLENCPHQST